MWGSKHGRPHRLVAAASKPPAKAAALGVAFQLLRLCGCPQRAPATAAAAAAEPGAGPSCLWAGGAVSTGRSRGRQANPPAHPGRRCAA